MENGSFQNRPFRTGQLKLAFLYSLLHPSFKIVQDEQLQLLGCEFAPVEGSHNAHLAQKAIAMVQKAIDEDVKQNYAVCRVEPLDELR